MIRVVIADDHSLVREGLRRILSEQKDIRVVGEAANAHDAVALVRQRNPDIILLDIAMPVNEGIEATKEIVALKNSTQVLILTFHTNKYYAKHLLQIGAKGFFIKNAQADELVNAIRQVHEGKLYLPHSLASALAEDYVQSKPRRKRSRKESVGSLSGREFQVMCFLAKGFKRHQIATRLRISVKTVDTHRSHALKKLKLSNNAEIVRYCILHKIIPD